MLQDLPHKMLFDDSLAAIVRLKIGSISVIVDDAMMKVWDIDRSTLFRDAHKSHEKILHPIFDNIISIYDDIPEKYRLYIFTNKELIYGASSMMFPRNFEALADKVGTDLYILPSSIDEVLAITVDIGKADDVMDLVRNVNLSCLPIEKQLSDDVFVYDREKKAIMTIDKYNDLHDIDSDESDNVLPFHRR